jgi:hypothetical protein
LRLILNNNTLANGQQRKEKLYVNSVVGKVADVDLGRRSLSRIVPKDISVARIAAGDAGVGLKQKQTG